MTLREGIHKEKRNESHRDEQNRDESPDKGTRCIIALGIGAVLERVLTDIRCMMKIIGKGAGIKIHPWERGDQSTSGLRILETMS